jgi:hypothetical protein
MSDIFISYANADQSNARQLAEILQAYGWTVWWDRKIPPGSTFNKVIGDAIRDAKCVIVL